MGSTDTTADWQTLKTSVGDLRGRDLAAALGALGEPLDVLLADASKVASQQLKTLKGWLLSGDDGGCDPPGDGVSTREWIRGLAREMAAAPSGQHDDAPPVDPFDARANAEATLVAAAAVLADTVPDTAGARASQDGDEYNSPRHVPATTVVQDPMTPRQTASRVAGPHQPNEQEEIERRVNERLQGELDATREEARVEALEREVERRLAQRLAELRETEVARFGRQLAAGTPEHSPPPRPGSTMAPRQLVFDGALQRLADMGRSPQRQLAEGLAGRPLTGPLTEAGRLADTTTASGAQHGPGDDGAALPPREDPPNGRADRLPPARSVQLLQRTKNTLRTGDERIQQGFLEQLTRFGSMDVLQAVRLYDWKTKSPTLRAECLNVAKAISVLLRDDPGCVERASDVTEILARRLGAVLYADQTSKGGSPNWTVADRIQDERLETQFFAPKFLSEMNKSRVMDEKAAGGDSNFSFTLA